VHTSFDLCIGHHIAVEHIGLGHCIANLDIMDPSTTHQLIDFHR